MLYLADSLQPLFRQWFFPAEHLLEAAPAIKDNARIGIEKGWQHIDAHLAEHGPHPAR